MTVISLKIQLQDQLKRCTLDLESSQPYERTKQLICGLFPQCPEFQLKFSDDEDELCTVSSDMELLEAVNVSTVIMNRPCVKLFMIPLVDDSKVPHQEPEPEPEQQVQQEEIKQPASKPAPTPEPEAKKAADVKADAKSEAPAKEEILTMAIDFFQHAEIQTAIPEVLRLFARDLHEVKDEKTADEFVGQLVRHSPSIANHRLIHVMLPRIRPCLVKKLPCMATHSTMVNEHVSKLLEVLPQLLQALPDVLSQVLQSVKEGGQRACAPFFQLLPLIGPLLFQMKQSMREAFQGMPQFGAGCNPFFAGSCGPRGGRRGRGGRGRHPFMHPFMHPSMRSAAPSQSSPESKAPAAKSKVHAGIICDGCSQSPIQGVRFKCTVCPDYDLCGACEAKNVHPVDHPLIKLRVAPRTDVHHNVSCDDCGVSPITGPRFKCTRCPNYDLCGACEAKNEHPADHPLIKLRVAASGPVHGFGHGRFHGPFSGMRAGRCGRGRGRGRGRAGRGRDKGCRGGRRGWWAQQVQQAQQAHSEQPTPQHQPECKAEIVQLWPPQQQQQQQERQAQQQQQQPTPQVEEKNAQPEASALFSNAQPEPEEAAEEEALEEEAPSVHQQQAQQQAQQPAESPSQPAPSPARPIASPTGPFAEQLHALRNMGLGNDQLNLQLLRRYRGNVSRTVDRLLNQ